MRAWLVRETQTAATVDETIARLEKKKGIEGILIVGRDGKVIRSTAPDAATAKYALTLTKLVDGARTKACRAWGVCSGGWPARTYCVRGSAPR